MKKICSVLLCLILLCVLPLSAAAAWPYVVDEAGLLTDSQRSDLMEECIRIRDNTGMEVAIVTVNSLDGKSAMAYADDYFEAHYGENGILLLISMGEREWHISTCGTGIEAYADADLVDMENGIMRYLPEGQYYDAFDQFLLDAQYHAADTAASNFTTSLVLSIPVGAVIAGIILLIMRGMMNTKTPKHSAEDYLNQGSYRLTKQQDLFLYSNVTKTPRPQQSSGGSGRGGSIVHRSSSGRSHGGRGGKF